MNTESACLTQHNGAGNPIADKNKFANVELKASKVDDAKWKLEIIFSGDDFGSWQGY